MLQKSEILQPANCAENNQFSGLLDPNPSSKSTLSAFGCQPLQNFLFATAKGGIFAAFSRFQRIVLELFSLFYDFGLDSLWRGE